VSQPGIRKAGFIVLVGSGLGFGVSFLLTPFISRVFQPSVYGSFATIAAVSSVFVGVSTFRLEIQSQRVTSDTEATGLLRLGLFASCIWGAALTLAALVVVLVWDVNRWWLATGVLVTLASLQLLGAAALTRARSYRNLAVANFVQGASLGVAQLLLGSVSAGVGSLLVGFGVSRLGWLLTLRHPGDESRKLVTLWAGSRRFAAIAGGSAFINSLASQLPVLLTSAFYGNATVGQLAIALRILVSPLGIIGEAAAAANIGEVGRLLREQDVGALLVVEHGMRDLFLVGLVPCAVAGGFGVWVVPLALGEQWHEAGLLVALLAIGTLAQFVVAPFSQVLNLTGRTRSLLAWDVGRFCAMVLSFSVPWALGLSSAWAIGSFSVSLVLVYGTLARLTIHAVGAAQMPNSDSVAS
jgi:O-antigen/teichoic acid export membrane protein